MSDDEFQLRVGRIRSRGTGGPRTFVGEALAAAQRAGGLYRRAAQRSGTFGRGRSSSLRAQRGLGPRARGAVVKARVVRQSAGRAPLSMHLDYLQREGVDQAGDRGRLFDAEGDTGDAKAFVGRCEGDRHHFRFIVSPDDAEQLSDLKAYTRDLMRQAENDLGAKLDWVAVDHWNTAHPHVHILVRGRDANGQDLVISRDYISQGLRARAGQLVTLELGPRSDAELRQRLDQQISADRWTPLDRDLARCVGEQDGLIDLRPPTVGRQDPGARARIARLQKLRGLGLAEEVRPGRWRLAPDAEPVMRQMGQREDIVARINRALAGDGVERDPAYFGDYGGAVEEGVVGRLAGRGLDNELTGSGYAVIDGADGRAHYIPLRDLEDASDAPLGAIVEVRRLEWQGRKGSLALAVRSDLSLQQQVQAKGATWLDRQLVGRSPTSLGAGGFGREVADALERRIDHLAGQGLAQRLGRRVTFARDLLEALRDRELAAAARRLTGQTGLPHLAASDEGAIAGIYRQRLNLASGRFAMIDNGLGFSLVPWRREMERHLGREVSGLRQAGGGIAWSFGPKRGPGR